MLHPRIPRGHRPPPRTERGWGSGTMSTWTDALAEALDVSPLGEDEAERLLDASRDVAHRVQRKVTPLTAFLVGTAVGEAVARGTTAGDALDDALATVARLLPADDRGQPGDP